MTPTARTVTCAGCGAGRAQPIAARSGRPRTPAGWKQLQQRLWCAVCKRQRFVLRAIALPVSGPSEATWPDLRAALDEAFGETTRCTNWLMTELYARDRQRQPGSERLPKMPPIYLYPEARALFPALASQTLASLERQVQARYRAIRLDLIWRHATSLPSYRYPAPLPLPARMWTLARQDQRWHLSARIGDRRWRLRLRQGPGMRRQMRVLEQIDEGTVEAGEATLYEERAHRGDGRSVGTRDRRLMVKLAVWLARREAAAAKGTLMVRTADDAFVTAQVVGQDERLVLNGDHVRRWIAEAARRQQRLRDERAFDGRPQDGAHGHPHGHGHGHAELAPIQRRLAEQLHRRLHTWTHQATARIVSCAQRRRVSEIAWDDTNRGYLPSYPWHRFVTMLNDKAGAVGIRVMAESPAPVEDGSRDDVSHEDRAFEGV